LEYVTDKDVEKVKAKVNEVQYKYSCIHICRTRLREDAEPE